MREFEMVREIENSCERNQMRDVFFEEIQCQDPEQYVRDMFAGQQYEIDVQRQENGNWSIFVRSGNVDQKFLFTPLDD